MQKNAQALQEVVVDEKVKQHLSKPQRHLLEEYQPQQNAYYPRHSQSVKQQGWLQKVPKQVAKKREKRKSSEPFQKERKQGR